MTKYTEHFHGSDLETIEKENIPHSENILLISYHFELLSSLPDH